MLTFPNAKINLGLRIIEKRPDGYHNLETIFYPVPVEDALEITELKNSTEPYLFQQVGLPVPGDLNDNLVVKAYQLMKERYSLPPIDIHLIKHTPLGAGLGGGSSDAAFMLKLLNQQFALGASDEELEGYAAQLGADCAFFIKNKPVYAEGIGNLFSPIDFSLAGYQIILIKPDVFVSTRDAFAQITPKQPELSLKEIIRRPLSDWKELMVNDFEASIFPKFPIIQSIKEQLYAHGAFYAAMSGSGSSVFGLFAPDSILPKLERNREWFYFEGRLK